MIWNITLAAALLVLPVLLYASLHPAVALLSLVVLSLTACGAVLAGFGRMRWLLPRIMLALCVLVAFRAIDQAAQHLRDEGPGYWLAGTVLAGSGALAGWAWAQTATYVGGSYMLLLHVLTILLLWTSATAWWLNDGTVFVPVALFAAGFAIALCGVGPDVD